VAGAYRLGQVTRVGDGEDHLGCGQGVADGRVLSGPGEHDPDDLTGGGDQWPPGVAGLNDRRELIDLPVSRATGALGRCHGVDGGGDHCWGQREGAVLGVARRFGAGARWLDCG